jgi:predicted AAA+ superfamily ATPase
MPSCRHPAEMRIILLSIDKEIRNFEFLLFVDNNFGLRKVGLESDEQVWAYLTSVFNTIMLKDIIERHDIRNVPFLMNLLDFYVDTTGKLTSANSISKYMKSLQEDVSPNLILLYRGYYAEAFLLDIVPRYDIHGKKLFESLTQRDENGITHLSLRTFLKEGL